MLISLADQANDDGVCWPSQGSIMARTNLSESSVRRALRSLESVGLLTTTSKSIGDSSRGNSYQLDLNHSGQIDRSPPVSVTGEESATSQDDRSPPVTETGRHQSQRPVYIEPSDEPSIEPSIDLPPGNPDDQRFTRMLYAHAKKINPMMKDESTGKWMNEFRILRELESVPVEHIEQILEWIPENEFWRTQITSPQKLRRHWNTLTAQMLNPTTKGESHARPQSANEVVWNGCQESI